MLRAISYQPSAVRFRAIVILGLLALLIAGCVPKPPAKISQPVTVMVQAPPVPPSAEELEKPPNVALERPERDPFAPLAGEGGVAVAAAGDRGAAGSFILSGIMMGESRSSAILESGTMSYIVHSGDHVGGYKVSSISARNVVLVKGKEKLVLTLLQ